MAAGLTQISSFNYFAQVDGSGNVISFTAGTAADPSIVGGNVAAGAADSGNPVKIGGKYNSTSPTLTDGQRGDLQLTTLGTLKVALMGSAGTKLDANLVSGDTSGPAALVLPAASYGLVYNGSSWDRSKKPNTAFMLPSCLATTNASAVKASAGDVFALTAYNTTAAVKFLKIYNKTSAPTVGTDTPIFTFAIPPNGTVSHTWPNGFYLPAGIAFALTALAATADTTALAAGDVVGLNISYQ